jgi:hypothetical protein
VDRLWASSTPQSFWWLITNSQESFFYGRLNVGRRMFRSMRFALQDELEGSWISWRI